MSDFQNVQNAEASTIKARKLMVKEKSIQLEIQLSIWLPKSMVKENPDGTFEIPNWIIAKSIK